jgi:hypothetical protein
MLQRNVGHLFLLAASAFVSYAAFASSSSAQVSATGAGSGAAPETLQQMRKELEALRAEEAAARAAEQRRAQRIEALARQLGVPPAPASIEAPPATVPAQTASTRPAVKPRSTFEVYGFAQADYIQDFNRVDQNWDATLRPSKIPTTKGIYGSDGQGIISVRQSRFGVKASEDVGDQPLSGKFEFDLFGTGVDEGQTTFRLRHAYGSWGPLLAGQTNTVFMDIDTFPNVIDYWGPNGMIFIRTPQIRYTYKSGGQEFAAALEYVTNDIDPGNIRLFDPALGSNIRNDEKFPDVTMHYRYDDSWGHAQIAGIIRRVGFDTPGTPDNEPKGHKIGWGINLSSNINTWGKDVIHLSGVYGEGIASYMNDGGTDLGPKVVFGPVTPQGITPVSGLEPAAVPIWGLMAYYDHYWNDRLSSSLGYSLVKVDNTNFQEPSAFQVGEYASVNLLYLPDPDFLIGAEFLWGHRKDRDGANGDDSRLQVSFKYTFSSKDLLP